MDCNTGKLVDFNQCNAEEEKRLIEEGLRILPDEYKTAAMKKLAGKKETKVSLKSGGKLSRLCAQWRKEKKNKHIKKLGRTEINRRREQRRKLTTIKGGSNEHINRLS